MRIFILMSVLILSGCGLSPLQYQALHDVGAGDRSSHRTISGNEIESMLTRYPEVSVVSGEYEVVKPYEMPIASWCSPFDELGKPLDWDCKNFSLWADEKMSGYSFGIAWTNGKPGHMLNVMIIDDNGRNRIAFYEPQDCLWVKPGEVAGIIVN